MTPCEQLGERCFATVTHVGRHRARFQQQLAAGRCKETEVNRTARASSSNSSSCSSRRLSWTCWHTRVRLSSSNSPDQTQITSSDRVHAGQT